MSQKQLDDLNIESQEVLITPRALKEKLPLSETAAETVFQGRQQIRDILDRKDPRLFVVIGPCSIHDPKAAMEYAERLKKLAAEVDDALFLVLRVYFEKPRTTVGWKGLINDPYMNDSFKVQDGLHIARKLLLDVADSSSAESSSSAASSSESGTGSSGSGSSSTSGSGSGEEVCGRLLERLPSPFLR